MPYLLTPLMLRDIFANAKSFSWAIYAAGLAIWVFGYFVPGHVSLFDWAATTPWWISSFVPNLEAELGLALMVASGIPTLPFPWARLFAPTAVLAVGTVTLVWWGFLGWLVWQVI